MILKKPEVAGADAREEGNAYSRLFELLLAERESIIKADNIKQYEQENQKTDERKV